MEIKKYSDIQEYRAKKSVYKQTLKDIEGINSSDISIVSKGQLVDVLEKKAKEIQKELENFIKFNLHQIDSFRGVTETFFFNNENVDLVTVENVIKADYVMLENGEIIDMDDTLRHNIKVKSRNILVGGKYFLQSYNSNKTFEPLYAYRIKYIDIED